MKSKSKSITFRQGDVLLRKIDTKPEGLKPRSKGPRVILAHGEATGHHHSISRTKATDYTDGAGGTVIVAKEGAVLEHQEHSAIQVPPGVYRGIRQREYTPSAIRNVAD